MGCGTSKKLILDVDIECKNVANGRGNSRDETPPKNLPSPKVIQDCKSEAVNIDDIWAIVKKTSDSNAINVMPVKNRKGWRMIRIFVSSTFKDFHQEREVLVKEVFPDLRLWCEQRKLRLVECDLRWGVPKDSTTEETINICLNELDRCFEDNVAPFFLNLAGERVGWVPTDISQSLASQYGWVFGLSVTEMEIVHGALRKLNPNGLYLGRFYRTIKQAIDALFLMRDSSCLDAIPDNIRLDYQDQDELSVAKLKALKHIISDTFKKDCVHHYNVEGLHQNGVVKFNGLDRESYFAKTVYTFFKDRIEELYPLDPSPENPLQAQKEAHEAFMESHSLCVLGRDELIKQIASYLKSDSTSPLLVVGRTGAGKSALMAKCAKDALCSLKQTTEPQKVFVHFVGSTPGSTDLTFFLQRLLKECKPDMKDNVNDLETLIHVCNGLMSDPNTALVFVFIDAVNQFDEDKQQLLSRWLPERLSSNVRVVVSLIERTESHQILRSYKPPLKEVMCGPLDQKAREEIVSNILRMYNKRLDSDQLQTLISKDGSSNPLWLTLACEELRVFGKFEQLKEKIVSLPDDLISLEMEVFSRFESEDGGWLIEATLCLLEVSRYGLLETELLVLLADEDEICCPMYFYQYDDLDDSDADADVKSIASRDFQFAETLENVTEVAFTFSKEIISSIQIEPEDITESFNNEMKLPARDWALLYRNLKPLLRPFGDLGEGRLDFYHRSLSKAVRKKYFEGTTGYTRHKYEFWHGVLANFFESVDDMERKAEELPYHLEKLLSTKRLIKCLLHWPIFDQLFHENFSIDLLRSWQKAGGYGPAAANYRKALKATKKDTPVDEYAIRLGKVAVFLIQAGEYEETFPFLSERLDLEINELGNRVDKLADIYQTMAKCKSEYVNSFEFIRPPKVIDSDLVVEWCWTSLEYRNQLSGGDNEFKSSTNKVVLCHHLCMLANMDEKHHNHRVTAERVITEAIETFTKINDIGHLSEALMTKTLIHPRSTEFCEQRLKDLDQSADLCEKTYGKKHVLYLQHMLNIGLTYQDSQKLNEAHDYYVKWHDGCAKVLGLEHPKTIGAINVLGDPLFASIAEKKARQTAENA